MSKKREGALTGLKVLDLTRVLAGPYCTMLMADMGAEVLKVEIPNKGDDTRSFGPFANDESLYFANINRSKKSITLNLKSQEGKEIFYKLVKEYDIVVENYRPDVMDKLGLGYDVLKEINPRVIYAAVSGFGSYGPYSHRPGYDIIAQAMGGLMSITGQPGNPPTRTGNAMGDILGGLNLAIGVLAAVNNRHQTGLGQKIDLSLVDCVVSSLEVGLERYMDTQKVPERVGNRYNTLYPYDSFPAKDGELVIGCGNQKLWEEFAVLANLEHLLEVERYKTPTSRLVYWEELKVIISEWTMQYTVAEAVDLVLGAGVPSAPIYNFADLIHDPHIADAREMFVDIEHPVAGNIKLGGCALKFSDTKNEIRFPSPLLGQSNEDVYENLGMTPEEIAEYKAKGIF